MTALELIDKKFAADMLAEARASRARSPGPKPIATILFASVGTLALALMEIRSGKMKDWWKVHDAAVAVAAMALRIAEEGDPVLGVVPTEENCA